MDDFHPHPAPINDRQFTVPSYASSMVGPNITTIA
jgi:hypothetical protein